MDRDHRGGIKVKSDYSIFREIFDKSPMGILLCDEEGKLVDANGSALEIMGIHKLEYLPEINLFNNPLIAFEKEEILKKGLINFKNELDFENLNGVYSTKDIRYCNY